MFSKQNLDYNDNDDLTTFDMIETVVVSTDVTRYVDER